MHYTSFITKVLEEASQIAQKGFGKVAATVKEGDNNQVLTETDLEIGRFLVSQVQKSYPDHNIIDEEAGVIDKKSEITWVIDPVDGTSNFAQGLPLYGIMIGLLHNAVPIAGGIALPRFNEICVAEKGKGAFCNGNPISVTKETRLLSALVAYQMDGHQEKPEMTRAECQLLAEIVLGIRNMRTSNSVFDAVMVAKGKYGACLNRTTKIWDQVAQQILIEEAGGTYTDFFGNPIDYSDPLTKAQDNFTVCCGAPELYRQLQNIIHKK